jgi:hypothetical protein
MRKWCLRPPSDVRVACLLDQWLMLSRQLATIVERLDVVAYLSGPGSQSFQQALADLLKKAKVRLRAASVVWN